MQRKQRAKAETGSVKLGSKTTELTELRNGQCMSLTEREIIIRTDKGECN